MPKSPIQNLAQKLQAQLEQTRRRLQRRRAERERTYRQDEVLKSAAGAKQARQRSHYFQGLRRTAAERRAAFGQALHWDVLRRRGREFGGGAGKPKLRRFVSRMVYGIAVFSLIANVVLFLRWSPARPLLTIGKHVVSRREYEAGLDAAAGKAVLSRIVLAELVRQAAARAGVTPTAADIDARLASLRRKGIAPAKDTPDVREAVGQDLALENLRVKGIPVSDAEIAAEYAKHPEAFSLPAQMQATLVVAQNAAGATQAVHLLGVGTSPSGIGAIPGLHVDGVNGFAIPAAAIPLKLRASMLALKDGQVQTYAGRGAYLVVKAKTHVAGSLPPLPQIRTQVARQVQLDKAPSPPAEMLTLYAANKPVFDMTNYQPYLGDIEAAADAAAPAHDHPGAPAKTASLPH